MVVVVVVVVVVAALVMSPFLCAYLFLFPPPWLSGTTETEHFVLRCRLSTC